MSKENEFRLQKSFELNGKKYNYFGLKGIEEAGLGKVDRLPYSIRILLESVIRQYDGRVIKDEHIAGLAQWGLENDGGANVAVTRSGGNLRGLQGTGASV